MEEYAIQMPKNILKFISENECFQGEIRPEDILESSCCFDLKSDTIIMYKANINNIITWELDKNNTRMWVNKSLYFIDENPYKLSFLDI